MTGITKKELFGIPPSDTPTSIVGFDLFRISSEGKIVEMWSNLVMADGHNVIAVLTIS